MNPRRSKSMILLLSGGLLALVGLVRSIPTSSAQDPAPAPKAKPAVTASREVSFTVKNDTGEASHVPTVRGRGNLPVRFDIKDDGFGKKERHLQLFIAVHKREHPRQFIPGDLVKTYLGPEVMVSPADKARTAAANADIPLPPGEYLFYVFLCDPDHPPHVTPGSTTQSKQYQEMPGMILNSQLCAVHVD